MRCGKLRCPPHKQKLSALTKESHAYLKVKCIEHGPDGYRQPNSPSGGHGKSFGTMMHAVNARALYVIGLKGDPETYPIHEFSRDEVFPP